MPPESDDNLIDSTLAPTQRVAQSGDVTESLATGARQLLHEMQLEGSLTPFQIEQLRNGDRYRLVVGPYVVLEPLAKGGMGEVFRALHHLMKREVALKLIGSQHRDNPEVVKRFLREVRALAALRHPNIVSVYDAGGDGDRLYLAMELVPGIDLQEYLEDHGPLPVAEACDLIRQTALGLQHAHMQALVHRDVKPENLMRTHAGQIKILDLGLALFASGTTLTRFNPVMGTAHYMAPEQVTSAHTVDIRADIYSLGCTLYHLLAGRVPFADAARDQVVSCHLEAEPPALERFRPELPRGLLAVLRRMMCKNRDERYQNPGELAMALEPFTRPDRPPQLGDVVAGWLIEEVLDPDARLYRAVKDDRTVLLHLLSAAVKGVPPALQAFAELRHPSLMEVQQCGFAESWKRCYVVLRMENGPALEEYLARRGPLEWKTARSLFHKLADALATAHARNIVHGNIHPASIRLRLDGSPVLVDFDLTGGVSRRRVLGNATEYPLLFAAPEQVHKGRVDARGDVYSLAAVLYYSLAYKHPESREPADFDPQRVPEELRDVLAQSLDRHSERRPADAAAFRDALRATAGPRR